MWPPGSTRPGAICGLSLLLVLALLRGFYSCFFPVFLPPQKPTSPNSNLTRIEDPRENQPRPGSYVRRIEYSTFKARFIRRILPCRIQFSELNSTELRRLNRLPHFCRTFDWSCRIIRKKCDTDSNVEFLPCRI